MKKEAIYSSFSILTLIILSCALYPASIYVSKIFIDEGSGNLWIDGILGFLLFCVMLILSIGLDFIVKSLKINVFKETILSFLVFMIPGFCVTFINSGSFKFSVVVSVIYVSLLLGMSYLVKIRYENLLEAEG